MIGRVVAKRCATNEVRLNLRVETNLQHAKRVRAAARLASESGAETAAVSLVYSSELQDSKGGKSENKKPRCGFGTLSSARAFTVYGRKTVKESCAVIERTYGRDVLFCTVTIPGSEIHSQATFAAWSGYALLLFNQRIRDMLHGAQFVSVWEWQKRGALHLHVALAHPDKARLERFGVYLRKTWHSVLVQVGERAGVCLLKSDDVVYRHDRFPLLVVDAQWIKKSLGRYLSKYLSKGATGECKTATYPPPRWWSVDKTTLREVHDARETIESEPEVMGSASDLWSRLSGRVAAYSEKTFWYESVMESGSYFLVLHIRPDALKEVWAFIQSCIGYTYRKWGYQGAGKVLTAW